MNKKDVFLYSAVAILAPAIIIATLLWYSSGKRTETPAADGLAACLSEKGAVMYGADWCSHCQNQKKQFGDSFRMINYVECPQDPKKCLNAGVESFPTWIFRDGKKLVGEQSMEDLARASGCPPL